MKSHTHEIGDVLLIERKGSEVVARVADYIDSMDNTTPLLCNLRVSDGKRWGSATVKVLPAQIIKPLPDWQKEQHKKWEASIKETANAVYARMSPEQKAHLEKETERRRNRSPLDIMIDQACGIE